MQQTTPQTPHSADRELRPVVLFDGGCPMCSREIAFYRRQPASQALEWVDISRETDTEARFGIRHDDAMQRFHVRDPDGKWQTGAFGFAELWSHFPGWRVLSGVLRRTALLPLIDRVYERFARWRLKRQCADGTCSTTSDR
jgi:predicted DCC family thiol-disulfide oxidoreductase YuxK